MKFYAVFPALIIIVAFSAFRKDNNDKISEDPFSGSLDIILQQEDTCLEPEDSLAILKDLCNIIKENDSIYPEETAPFPIILNDIIQKFSTKPSLLKTNPEGVLSYLTSVFSEHGYNETGGWVKNRTRNWKSYVPYKGSLPVFDITDFQLPANGKLTSLYGYRPKFGRFHRGIDFALNIGDTVCSALPGVVTLIGYENGGYGRYVIVTHSGGMETLYGHLTASMVSIGQKLEAGEVIGLAGNTGNSTGPHLHFETRYRGVAIDPISWFDLSERFR